MLVELGWSGEIKLTKVRFFWSELWNKLSIVRLVNFHSECRTWKCVHPWLIILWVYIDMSHGWKWFYPRMIAFISSRGSKQFHLRLIVLRCQHVDGNNSTHSSYCFSVKPRMETILSAAHIVLLSSHGWKQFYQWLILFQCQAVDGNNSTRGLYCFSIEPRIETIRSTAHIVSVSSRGWKQFYLWSHCFSVKLQIETILSVAHIVLLSSCG